MITDTLKPQDYGNALTEVYELTDAIRATMHLRAALYLGPDIEPDQQEIQAGKQDEAEQLSWDLYATTAEANQQYLKVFCRAGKKAIETAVVMGATFGLGVILDRLITD